MVSKNIYYKKKTIQINKKMLFDKYMLTKIFFSFSVFFNAIKSQSATIKVFRSLILSDSSRRVKASMHKGDSSTETEASSMQTRTLPKMLSLMKIRAVVFTFGVTFGLLFVSTSTVFRGFVHACSLIARTYWSVFTMLSSAFLQCVPSSISVYTLVYFFFISGIVINRMVNAGNKKQYCRSCFFSIKFFIYSTALLLQFSSLSYKLLCQLSSYMIDLTTSLIADLISSFLVENWQDFFENKIVEFNFQLMLLLVCIYVFKRVVESMVRCLDKLALDEFFCIAVYFVFLRMYYDLFLKLVISVTILLLLYIWKYLVFTKNSAVFFRFFIVIVYINSQWENIILLFNAYVYLQKIINFLIIKTPVIFVTSLIYDFNELLKPLNKFYQKILTKSQNVFNVFYGKFITKKISKSNKNV